MSVGQDFTLRSAARSHTGLVRKNNQDSGYAGPNLLLVADGMGGHAGGDVASAITVARLSDLDTPEQGSDALDVLRQAILDANGRITQCVAEKPELAGMGTTVTALLRTGTRLALAHIGDSRAYLLRDGEVSLVTHDHTFVQMLVDEGRITPGEAESHPQRSVVMRVLGDVGAAPDLDLSLRDTQPGDRWMLCSDGLTGFSDDAEVLAALTGISDPGECCDKLVDLALDGGGADNITVIIGDVVPADAPGMQGESVGSVDINPQFALLGQTDSPTELIQNGRLDVIDGTADTQQLSTVDSADMAAAATPAAAAGTAAAATPAAATAAASVDSAASPARTGNTQPLPAGNAARMGSATSASGPRPEADGELGEWGTEDPPPRRRPLLGLLITLFVLVAVGVAGLVGWNYIRSQYYIAEESGSVAIYRGLAQTLGPIDLGSLEEITNIDVNQLSTFSQGRLEETIPAPNRDAADQVVQTLREEAQTNARSSDLQGGVPDAPASPDPAPTSPPDSEQQNAPAAENNALPASDSAELPRPVEVR